MTANSEQIKIKKFHNLYMFYNFLSPLPFCLDDFLKSWSPSYPIFWNFHSTPFKKGGKLETMCIHLKIYETIFAPFCVFPLKHFDVFWMFLLLLTNFDMVPCKDFPTFLWPNKTQGRQ